jgi:Ser/Thr protein kinase RdoA (MazF antagonist)
MPPADFSALTPDTILDAIESIGLRPDARLIELNSYENRVYQIGIEDGEPIIAKFYRANRWTDEQILEEHQFTFELKAEELSVVAPISIERKSLLFDQQLRFSVFPRQGGRAPPVDDLSCLETLGRHIAMIHSIGSRQPFNYRPAVSFEAFGHQAAASVLSGNLIPDTAREGYRAVTDQILAQLEQFRSALTRQTLRVHGDCHMGNVLWRESQPHFVDFDDARTGPAIQDLWMLLSGPVEEQISQWQAIMRGYRALRDFDPSELQLIEPLRTLRLIHHAAWVSQRWEEPAFQRAFSFIGSEKFWSEHILALREQLGELSAGPSALTDQLRLVT